MVSNVKYTLWQVAVQYIDAFVSPVKYRSLIALKEIPTTTNVKLSSELR